MSILCSSCGTPGSGAAFCANCGTKMPETLDSDRKRASSAQLLATVAINPMEPSEGSTEEGGAASWKEKIQKLRKGEVTWKIIYITVALTLMTMICTSLGAGFVAKGVLTSTNDFACCTTIDCNYAGYVPPWKKIFQGSIKIDPKLVSVSDKGVCIGPDLNGHKCDGTQPVIHLGTKWKCGVNFVNNAGQVVPNPQLKTELALANQSAIFYVYSKLALVAWGFFLFLCASMPPLLPLLLPLLLLLLLLPLAWELHDNKLTPPAPALHTAQTGSATRARSGTPTARSFARPHSAT
jgi:hypothetical protein